jgi:tetratricopeptide (TPR) repeat protein
MFHEASGLLWTVLSQSLKLTDSVRTHMEEVARLKDEGNAHFRARDYQAAIDSYTEAIFTMESEQLEPDIDLKSALFANRAACLVGLDSNPEQCLSDCDRALAIKTPYPRVRCRRFWALRQLNKKNDALTELKKAIEEDPSIADSHARELREIQVEADQETEKMKAEAMTQLKDLGNKFLGLFGLSTDNFQVQQNPDGGCNVQFVNKP